MPCSSWPFLGRWQPGTTCQPSRSHPACVHQSHSSPPLLFSSPLFLVLFFVAAVLCCPLSMISLIVARLRPVYHLRLRPFSLNRSSIIATTTIILSSLFHIHISHCPCPCPCLHPRTHIMKSLLSISSHSIVIVTTALMTKAKPKQSICTTISFTIPYFLPLLPYCYLIPLIVTSH